MDLIGEIVEHEPVAPVAPVIDKSSLRSGFPQLKKFELKKKHSRFKAKRSEDQPKPQNPVAPNAPAKAESSMTEAQRIHQENMDKIASYTEEELSQEREELLRGLDPKLIQSLLKRTEARAAEDTRAHHEHAEGHDGWIGGGKNGYSMPHLDNSDVNRALGIKTVQFSEEPDVQQIPMSHLTDESENEEGNSVDNEDPDDEIADEGYQIVAEEEPEAPEMHFPKPKAPKDDPELDINDPNFLDALHEKYYPDLPKETSKLAWMKAPMPTAKISTYEAISDMRFDFKGNLVDLDPKSQDMPTYLGLHHHSDNPQLAGYTLGELVHLSRSVVPTQRCLGIQMLGRILHKLGLHKYNILPVIDDEDDESNEVIRAESKAAMAQFEDMMWDLIEKLRVIDSLTDASDEARTKNLSVRTYAIEALWLWKQGGGRPDTKKKSEEDVIAEQLQNM